MHVVSRNSVHSIVVASQHVPPQKNLVPFEGIGESRHIDETAFNKHVFEYLALVRRRRRLTFAGDVGVSRRHVAVVFFRMLALHM